MIVLSSLTLSKNRPWQTKSKTLKIEIQVLITPNLKTAVNNLNVTQLEQMKGGGASHLLPSVVTGQISFLQFQVVDVIPEVIMLLSSQGRLMPICADRHADAPFLRFPRLWFDSQLKSFLFHDKLLGSTDFFPPLNSPLVKQLHILPECHHDRIWKSKLDSTRDVKVVHSQLHSSTCRWHGYTSLSPAALHLCSLA